MDILEDLMEARRNYINRVRTFFIAQETHESLWSMLCGIAERGDEFIDSCGHHTLAHYSGNGTWAIIDRPGAPQPVAYVDRRGRLFSDMACKYELSDDCVMRIPPSAFNVERIKREMFKYAERVSVA